MKVKIKAGAAAGGLTAPPSKSMAHRALICAYLSGGRCKIKNVALSQDIEATAGALRALGAVITETDGGLILERGGRTEDTLFCGESGSTLRFLIPLALTLDRKITLKGSKRLFSRSLEVYKTLSIERGFLFSQTEDSVTVRGSLKSGLYRVRGDISSQFISGLMFILPTLSGNSVIEIEGRLESRPYLDLTAAALRDFGVDIKISDKKIEILGNQKYTARDYAVEGDWSNAAFFKALNLLGGDVAVTGLRRDSLQGDCVCDACFAAIRSGAPDIDVSDCPDLAPVLMSAMAACGGGALSGTRRLRIKESDRGAAMAAELAKFGAAVDVKENSITVGKMAHPPKETLCGHNDHRIVMALAVLCTKTGGEISGAQAVSKSMPDFFEKLSGLGIETEITDEA